MIGIPALLALYQIAHAVDDFLVAIEAETRKLFPAAF
jgi:hypothetical protein